MLRMNFTLCVLKKSRSTVLSTALFALATILVFTGCAKESASLFEHDHEIPKNWPGNLIQAYEKIQARLDGKEDGLTHDEYVEMIGWVPEVLAETNVTEEEWNKINLECTSIVDSLASTSSIDATQLAKLESLANELKAIDAKLQTADPSL